MSPVSLEAAFHFAVEFAAHARLFLLPPLVVLFLALGHGDLRLSGTVL